MRYFINFSGILFKLKLAWNRRVIASPRLTLKALQGFCQGGSPTQHQRGDIPPSLAKKIKIYSIFCCYFSWNRPFWALKIRKSDFFLLGENPQTSHHFGPLLSNIPGGNPALNIFYMNHGVFFNFKYFINHKFLSLVFLIHLNTYVLGLRELEIFLFLQCRDRL